MPCGNYKGKKREYISIIREELNFEKVETLNYPHVTHIILGLDKELKVSVNKGLMIKKIINKVEYKEEKLE